MRVKSVLIAVGVSILGFLGVSTPAEAASGFQFSKIYYNSPGSDDRSNSSLNAEYVDIKNVTSSSHYIGGWRVSDAGVDHKYYIPGGVSVGAGKIVRIHTGVGANHKSDAGNWHLYMDLDNYVWNNSGDKAVLRKPDGTLKDTCSYSGGGSIKYC